MANSLSGNLFSFSCSCKDAKAISISSPPTSSFSSSSSTITTSSSSATAATTSSSSTCSDLLRHVASSHNEVSTATHNAARIRHRRRSASDGDACIRRAVGRRKVRESVAVVKETEDPIGDFRRSMVAMIVDKDMKTNEELRELLRWFLALNTPENHHLVLQAFSDVWELRSLLASRKAT